MHPPPPPASSCSTYTHSFPSPPPISPPPTGPQGLEPALRHSRAFPSARRLFETLIYLSVSLSLFLRVHRLTSLSLRILPSPFISDLSSVPRGGKRREKAVAAPGPEPEPSPFGFHYKQASACLKNNNQRGKKNERKKGAQRLVIRSINSSFPLKKKKKKGSDIISVSQTKWEPASSVCADTNSKRTDILNHM